MKEFVLGKEGDQPFEINQQGVSRRHAKVSIDDNDNWIVEDLGSSNGTYVRENDSGELRSLGQNGKVRITPLSFIVLGPDNAKGCGFYARQLLNPGNFNEEYEYLNEKEKEFDMRVDKVDNTAQKIKIIIFFVNILIVAYSFSGSSTSFWMLRIGTLLSTGFAAFYNPTTHIKKINAIRERFHHCPNPACSHRLRPAEIRNMRCNKCKK